MNLVIIPLSFFLGAIFKFPGGDCTSSFIKVPYDPTVVIFGSNSSNVSLHWECNISEASILTIRLRRHDPQNPKSFTTLAHRSRSGGENEILTNFAGRGLFFGSGCEATLLIFNVTVDDGKFKYRAEVSVNTGRADVFSGDISMVVAVHPMIVSTNPINKIVAVNESQPFTLSCNASGNPPPTVLWNKTSGSPLHFPNDTTLTVSNASSQHSGTYQCTAINLAGSNTATFVVVVQFPPKITVRPEQQTVCENQPVTISCDVEKGVPEPEVELINNTDGTILMSSHNKSSNYSIEHTVGHHSGNYSFLATNAAGTEKKTVSLHVEIAAKISITPNGSYERNTPLTLECSATGDPSPNVTWINITDGLVLQSSTTETSFLKPNVSFHHKGIYRCVAENKCGNDSKETTINIYTPTTPEKKGLQVEIIVLIAVIASILVIVIIAVIIWKVKRRRRRRGRNVTNGEEHKLNSVLEHAPYAEVGSTVISHQDNRSKEGKKPVPLYSEVDMSKRSKKKKPGQLLYADLDNIQPSVATENSNAQKPFKKPEKHQRTDYASITDVIKEEGGKSVKVPIAGSDRNISNNGSTISEP